MRNCWITLGAYGDCCNTLPLVLHDYQQGNHPTMFIARPFMDLLDGVGYCDRLVWDGHYSECLQAAEHAQRLGKFDNVFVVQCYGSGVGAGTNNRVTDSFCKEAWRLVGRLQDWDTLPLVFDRRDKDREAELLTKIGTRSKPRVLVSTAGKSSPFPHRDALKELLKPLSPLYDFIDLDGFKAERFYDLIGVMESAECLIATDSGPLHLANAVPNLPVVALITHFPDLWHGSPKRKNHALYIRYDEFSKRADEIATMLKTGCSRGLGKRLVHVWSDYERPDAGAKRRNRVASQTWQQEYLSGFWVSCPIHEKEFVRNGRSVGERKPVPFVKDLFNEGVKRASPGDIIVFSNDDTCFAPGLTDVLVRNVSQFGAVWGARREHKALTAPLKSHEITKGYQHCGSDIFAFTPEWWAKWEHDFPDFLLTFEAWDLVMKRLIDFSGGRELKDTCYHEIHASFWHVPENRECEGNLYNRELTRQWLARHNIKWEDAFK